MIVLGIDPGLSGALALYDDKSGALLIEDVPTLELASAGGKRRTVDHYAAARIIDDWNARLPIDRAVIERVNAMPSLPGVGGERRSMGATSAFRFGESYGLLIGICAANFLKLELVTPQAWKRSHRLTGDKDNSRACASAAFPAFTGLWSRKKDNGRAEAALIALYGARQVERVAA